MNSIPKLKINSVILANDFNLKHYFLSKENNLKTKFYWNKPGQIEIAWIDHIISSDFSSILEYKKISAYYRSILDQNKDQLSNIDIPIIFIGSSFDISKRHSKKPWDKFSNGKVLIPKMLLLAKNGGKKLYHLSIDNKIASANTKYNYKEEKSTLELDLISETSENKFIAMIDKAKNLIKDKKISKIVLSRQKQYHISSSNKILSNMLVNAEIQYPSCTNFVCDFQNQGVFFGITPEKLFTLINSEIQTVALAGTFESSDNLKIDHPKELKEHHYVSNYLKNILPDFSKQMIIEKKPHIISLNKIAHLKTRIKAKINDTIDAFDILYRIHPTPAVAGEPKNSSLDEISNLEEHERGWYGGPLGWIGTQSNSNFVISIRSGIIKDNILSIYAGCGITKDSIAKKEYMESELKFNYILSILKNE